MKTLYMETTAIDSLKTAGEIQSFLVQCGANAIMLDYKEKEIVGLYFKMHVNGQDLPFQLPVRVDPIFKILNGRRKFNRGSMAAADREQAKRVAWRQLYRWVQAQFALIETGMAEAAEVFMPYLQTGPNETLYQRAVAGGFRALLPAGGDH